jgi:hypothetical protein
MDKLPKPVLGTKMKTPSCVLDICVDLGQKTIKEADGIHQYKLGDCYASNQEKSIEGSFYVDGDFFESENHGCQEKTATVVNVQKKTASKTYNAMMTEESESVSDNGDFLVKRSEVVGCGGGSWKQEIFGAKDQAVEFSSLGKPYPKSLKIGNFEFRPTSSMISTDLYYFGSIRDNIEFTGALSVGDDVGAVLSQLAASSKFLSKSYIVSFTEYPGTRFRYEMADKKMQPSERIAYLGTDASWLSENLKGGNLQNLELSQKILSGSLSNDSNRVLILTGSMNETVTPETMTEAGLPYFLTVPFDGKGNYLIYTAKKYQFTTFAELCKPAVYAYDSKNPNGNKSLTVTLAPGGAFTKLIPDFTGKQSWDFRADAGGSVSVLGSGYPYLYYSAKVPNYRFNTEGWMVNGRDMEAFFENKLVTMGFNEVEKRDFMEFWIPEFHADRAYFVSFKFDDRLSPYAALNFSPAPDSVFRVLLESYEIPSVNPKFSWPSVGNAFDSKILRRFDRSGGYDVFEWGGTLSDKENTVIR